MQSSSSSTSESELKSPSPDVNISLDPITIETNNPQDHEPFFEPFSIDPAIDTLVHSIPEPDLTRLPPHYTIKQCKVAQALTQCLQPFAKRLAVAAFGNLKTNKTK